MQRRKAQKNSRELKWNTTHNWLTKKKAGVKEQQKSKGTKNRWEQQKTDRKTGDLNSSIFIIILNANKINIPSKAEIKK